MLAARGLRVLGAARWRAAATISVVVLSASALLTSFGSSQKDDWRGAVALIESKALPRDLVLPLPSFNAMPVRLYSARRDLDVRGSGEPSSQAVLDDVRQWLLAGRRVWIVNLASDTRAANTVVNLRVLEYLNSGNVEVRLLAP